MEGREGSIEQGMAGSFLAQSRMHSKHIRIQECSMNSAKFKILGQKDFLQAPDYSGKCEKRFDKQFIYADWTQTFFIQQ